MKKALLLIIVLMVIFTFTYTAGMKVMVQIENPGHGGQVTISKVHRLGDQIDNFYPDFLEIDTNDWKYFDKGDTMYYQCTMNMYKVFLFSISPCVFLEK